jgi:hypothetical protein
LWPIWLINSAFLLDGKERINSRSKKLTPRHFEYERRGRNTRSDFRWKVIKNRE